MFGNSLAQIVAVTTMGLRSVGERLGPTVVALVGIAGVVTVVVGVLSIGEGFRAVLGQSGADDVAVVLRAGATDEIGSYITLPETRIIADARQIARNARGAAVSSEFYVVADVPLKRTGEAANLPLRGVTAGAADLRQDFEITAGRMFEPGKFEVIAGRGAAGQFVGLDVGETLRIGSHDWQIVGQFKDAGSVAESELWTDAPVLQGAYDRGAQFQSVRVRLTSADALQAFKDTLTTDPRLNVRVYTEREYYEEMSASLVALIRTVGLVIAGLMGLGAVFAALNTMYSAVTSRTREIATLRALGFGAFPVVLSVLLEAALIGVAGGAVGVAIAYFALNGLQASTLNFSNFSQLTFAFAVTPELLLRGLAYALVLGFLGGLLPSIRAARLPIVTGLREL